MDVSFGNEIKKFGDGIELEIFGQSHAEKIGVRIKGLPAGLKIDKNRLQAFLERRAPGRNDWSTTRREADRPEFISGVKPAAEAAAPAEAEEAAGNGEANILETDGNILEAVIYNTDVRSHDYADTASVPRPAHADWPAWVKYGEIAPGGGQFSARMTAPLCIAGGIFMQWLKDAGIEIHAHIASIGDVMDAGCESAASCDVSGKAFPVIDDDRGEEMKKLISEVKGEGDSIGGTIECCITGLAAGIGSPIFGSIESKICQTVFAVPAVKGIEFGSGFAVSGMKGSENNDAFCVSDGQVLTKTNNHGGILGGLSSGMPVIFRTAMKPTPSIALEQDSVDLNKMEEVKLRVSGRHDPCIVPRAVPCIEAAAAVAIFDMMLEEGRIVADQAKAPAGAETMAEAGSSPEARQAEQATAEEQTAPKDLQGCRDEIDKIDKKLAMLLEDRLDIARQVIRYKDQLGLQILDRTREEELIDGLRGFCREETLTYIQHNFEKIMAESRRFQEDHRLKFGLLGKNLGHSHSPRVHGMLGGYDFGLFDRDEEQLDDFLKNGAFKGLSVTMPYKRAVMPYCEELSERAKACNSVNAIVRRDDGTLYGDNTDYYGFKYTVESSGVDVSGAKALVLGSGGVSGTVINVLRDLGADPIINISRSGEDNYENLDRHSDAQIIVNATPVGMFPKAGVSPIDLEMFPECRGVFDVVYNPLRTKIMLDAKARGIPAFGGLKMLVAQAAAACELFTGKAVEDWEIDAVTNRLQTELEHIILIGMPGCGKTTAGRILSTKTGREFYDLDEQIRAESGRIPEEIIREDGIDAFREIETETLRKIVRDPSRQNTESGLVISTGGGIVERDENRELLQENGWIVYVQRPLEDLPTENRPVTQSDGIEAIYDRRHGKYEDWSDFEVDNKNPVETAEIIEQIVQI